MQRSLPHLSGSESCVPPVNSERHVMPQFPNAFPVIISLPTISVHSFRDPTCTSPYPRFLRGRHFFGVPRIWSFNSSLKCWKNRWRSEPSGSITQSASRSQPLDRLYPRSILVPPISAGSLPCRISWTFLCTLRTPRWNVGLARSYYPVSYDRIGIRMPCD